ncbi:MAG: LytR C-terminal domain-containing protein [Fibromonadales bacterium]|nr:LytR C-terminal domain-containing protein [Fibromonadales bacterium]
MRFLLAAVCLFLFACEEESSSQDEARVERVPGQIVVYNSCGISGAAEQAREVLRAKGFDVLRENDPRGWQNYEETIVAIRNPHWGGQEQLKAVLDTENFIVLLDTLSGNIGAAVFLGKDYKKVLKIKRGQL